MPKDLSDVLAENKRTGRGHDEAGQPRPLTHHEFFEISREMGFNQDNPDYRALFENMSNWVKRRLPIQTALEIGSGPGYFLYCLNRHGIDCRGVDGNPYSKAYFDKKHPEYANKYVLDELFEGSYEPVDALFTIEVFEHIPDEGLHNILRKVRDEIKPRCIVFSSTPHEDPNPNWDLQWGHINLKQPEEWHKLFDAYGYTLHEAKPPITEWASLYVDSSLMSD